MTDDLNDLAYKKFEEWLKNNERAESRPDYWLAGFRVAYSLAEKRIADLESELAELSAADLEATEEWTTQTLAYQKRITDLENRLLTAGNNALPTVDQAKRIVELEGLLAEAEAALAIRAKSKPASAPEPKE